MIKLVHAIVSQSKHKLSYIQLLLCSVLLLGFQGELALGQVSVGTKLEPLFAASQQLVEQTAPQSISQALNPETPLPDLMVQQIVHSDSFRILGADTTAVLQQGEIYPVSITLSNWTSVAAEQVRLSYLAHDSLRIFSASPSPEVFTADSVVWILDRVDPLRALKFQVDVTIPDIMPVGENSVSATVKVYANNEDSSKLANNASTLQMLNYGKAAEPFAPLIEASPEFASPSDSIRLRVQFPVPIKQWDVWIYLPDGSVVTTFADAFIAANLPQPNQWYDIDVPFLPTFDVTTADQQVVFEVRATGPYGSFGSAQAMATFSAANGLALVPPNVVSPEMSEIPIDFSVPAGQVEMNVYDTAGRLVHKLVNDIYPAGRHTLLWNGLTSQGQHIGSGVYLVTLETADASTWKKMIVVR